MIDEYMKFPINLRIHLFESRYSENQLIIIERDNKENFLILNINKNKFENNDAIDMI